MSVIHGRAPGGYYRVDFSGEVDLVAAPHIQAALSGVAGSACRDVVLEVSRLTFLDVVGARLLGQFLVLTRQRGGRLTVRAAGPQVARTLEVTELAAEVVLEHGALRRRTLPGNAWPEDWRRRLN